MDKNVPAAVFVRNETEPFTFVEPFNGTVVHNVPPKECYSIAKK
ncbi:hypothetical protein SDC9_160207 [bioreactor metagenome]|uniref:Uncharacterized protein n=1 Tax=bioreactor metagenome TaxID=1076179 RepID=A0A645FF00_9ZZZZ